MAKKKKNTLQAEIYTVFLHISVGAILTLLRIQLHAWMKRRDGETETASQMVILWDQRNTNQMFVHFLHSFWESLLCQMHKVSGTAF